MERQTASSNGALCFHVDLLLPARQLQSFHVTECQRLRDCGSFPLGYVQIGELAQHSPGRADVTDSVIDVLAVLDPINLDQRGASFDGDREVFFWFFLHVVSCSFIKPKRNADVMQTRFWRLFHSWDTWTENPRVGGSIPPPAML